MRCDDRRAKLRRDVRRALLPFLAILAAFPATGEWRIDVVDDGGDAALLGTAITLDDSGSPMILYTGYWRMNLATYGGDAWSIETVETVYSGHPSMHDSSQGLQYVYWDGTYWGELIYRGPASIPDGIVDEGNDLGRWARLALTADGAPRISYMDNTLGNLKYAWFDGSEWMIETVDQVNHVGFYGALALDEGGGAHVAYCDSDAGALKLAHRQGGGWDIEVVVPQGASHPAVAWGPQGLHLAYYDGVQKDLCYMGPEGFPGGSIDSDGDVGLWPEMAVDELGWPHVCYRDVENRSLKYAYYDGTEWHRETVDSEGDVGIWTGMVLDADAHAHVSYHDAAEGNLKYAYNVTGPGPRPSPTPTAAPGTPTPTPTAVWYELRMPDLLLQPGETFLLERDCGNPDAAPLDVDEYILLDVYEEYWFWPGWVAYPPDIDWSPWSLSGQTSYLDPILEFVWPSGAGAAEGIRFWGAFLHQGTPDQLILYDMIEWGFSE